MTRSCFGDLGGVKNCWGYRLKLVRSRDELKLHGNTIFSKDKDTDYTIFRRFSMKELQKATKNFSTMVAKGGFSSYYKGTLENGTLLMIQVLLHSQVNEYWKLDFASTVSSLSQIRHRNVVQLLGCCFADDRTIIVYEFAGDYNLDQLLFGNLKAQGSQLDWSRRVFICIGIAHGLQYLHEGASHPIVHRDVKPSNIVLDGNFNPKIVGFGLAHVFDDDISHHSDTVIGTHGYLDPEYVHTGRYNEKVDVYSFGILLLEVISGRKVREFGRDGNEVTLVSWVWELRESDRILEILDPTLSDFPEDEVKCFVHVALSCVQSSSNLRPTMSEALLMLLGPCELSKKELRNPEESLLSSYYVEVDGPNHSLSMEKDAKMSGGFVRQLSIPRSPRRSSKFDEVKNPRTSSVRVPLFSSDPVSAKPTFGRTEDFPVSRSIFTTVPNQPVTRSKGKGTHVFETEIESDVDSHSSASELMEISHELETELYTSIEENISTLTYASGPSDENAVNPEHVNPSCLTKRALAVNQESVEGIEASEQNPVSHNLEDEIQMSEPSTSEFLHLSAVKDKVKVTSSGEIDSYIQNKSSDQIPVQAEIIERTEVLLQPKIDMKRPIQHTLEKILEALKDVDHRRICLYGRGGSGKTTVLKNLFQHLATKELFDLVLFVSVPRFAYKKHMQDEIVQQLLLDISKTCSEDEIFCIIHQALIDRKVLLLLDDVREPINLHEVGIPNPSPENSCWLVSATRSLDVCHLMADREIGMEVLSDAEAWEFFCCQVQGVIDSPEIEPYAQAISKECHGSPVIISAVGNALRGESSVKEWELALKNLQLGDKVNIDDQCFFRQHIKYCYDRLKACEMKTCFLYTALFQEDREIDVSMLVECFIKEGLVSGTTLASYNMGHDIVRRLTNASLLEANDNGLKVRMHNVVRDSALEILSLVEEGYQALVRLPNSGKDEDQSIQGNSWVTKLVDDSNTLNIQLPTTHKYLTRAGAHLKGSPSIEEWEQATMIFLMENELSSLPNKLNCSTLVALLLQRNSCLRVIPASFFDSMSTLKILNLSQTRIKSLPDSFSRLISLKILLLRDCERLLVLPPSIGLLKSLEVLDLKGTEVTHLPDCVGELANLELLRVSFYGSMNHSEYKRLPSKLVSDGIILSLRVRELGIFVYPGDQRWISNASNITKEISNLNLSALYFHFPEVENLEYFVHESKSWKSRILSTFSIVVGHDFKRVVSLDSNDAEVLFNEGQRLLRFVNGEDIPDAVVEILTRATSFYLDHHLTISYLSQFRLSSFDGVKICILRDCPKLIEIMDKEELETNIFPVLENLSIKNLWNLERIWVGRHIAMGSLARLRCLSVHGCPKLRYVFTCSMLDNLSNLEELVIEDCASLKYIVIGDKDVKKIMRGDDVDSVANVEGLPVLRCLKVLKLHYLPLVCGIWRGRWPLLEYMSFYNCPRLRNIHMKADDDVQIKEIATDKAWWDSLFWNDLELSRRLHKHLTQIHDDDL